MLCPVSQKYFCFWDTASTHNTYEDKQLLQWKRSQAEDTHKHAKENIIVAEIIQNFTQNMQGFYFETNIASLFVSAP